jgi:primosomal replication protein N
MKLSDLRALRAPLAVLLIVLLTGVAAVFYSKYLADASSQLLDQQQNQLREARIRYQKSGDEKEIITRYLSDYQRLQKQGFIGTEPRLNWLDGLRVANQQAELFGVEYQIGAQQPYALAAEYNPGNLSIQQSLMKLNFLLLHEGDLMRFFNILSTKSEGLFHLNQCKLERLDNSVTTVRFQPNVRAECNLTWITLNPADPARSNQ